MYEVKEICRNGESLSLSTTDGALELYLLEQAPRLPNAGASLICWFP